MHRAPFFSVSRHALRALTSLWCCKCICRPTNIVNTHGSETQRTGTRAARGPSRQGCRSPLTHTPGTRSLPRPGRHAWEPRARTNRFTPSPTLPTSCAAARHARGRRAHAPGGGIPQAARTHDVVPVCRAHLVRVHLVHPLWQPLDVQLQAHPACQLLQHRASTLRRPKSQDKSFAPAKRCFPRPRSCSLTGKV